MKQRAAYTTIELMVVIGVVVIITSMTAPAIFKTMKKSAVSGAASDILSLHERARSLAISHAQPDDDKHFGVVLAFEETPKPHYWAAIIKGGGGEGTSQHRLRVWKNADGTPVHKREFSRHVSIWSGSTELADFTAGQQEIAWYYSYRTGAIINADPGDTDFDTRSWSVGTEPVTFTNTYGIVDNNYTAPSISPPGTNPEQDPGISLRSQDGRQKVAIAIHAPGVPMLKEF